MSEDPKFKHFKELIMNHLDGLAKKEKSEVKKSILEAESMQKSGYPVGTIREWKGKKYIKIAPGKWRPKYDSNSRGAKMSIAALKKKADKCTSSEELLQLILENRERFSDENGRPLPFVKELSDYVSSKNDELESKKTKAVEKPKKERSAKKMKEKIQINETPEDRAQVTKTRAFSKEIETLTNSGNKADSVEDAIKALKKHKDFVHSVIPQNETLHEKATREGREEAIQSAIDKLKQGDKDIIAMFVKATEKQEEPKNADFTLDDISHIGDGKKTKKVNDMETAKNVIKQIAKKYGTTQKGRDLLNDFISLNIGGTSPLFDKIYAAYNISYDDLDMDFDSCMDSMLKQSLGKNDKAERKQIKDSKEDFSNKYREMLENEDRGSTEEEKPKKKAVSPEKTVKDIREKYESFKSVEGNKKTVTLPNGNKIKCHYKLVEAEAPTASHDEKTYAPTEGFPKNENGQNINDRDYQNDADAQESVRKIAANFNSLALESPPIVTKDGIVISGNNRTMSSKLAAKNGTDKAYLNDLREMIDEYGLEESDLDGFKNPRLVLEVDQEHKGDYTTEEFAQFNRDTKKTMSNVEKAVKLTKTLNEQKISSIASELSNYETMSDMYNDPKGSQAFVSKLIESGIIGDNEKAQYCKSDGTLNDTGKDFVETVLVGSVLNEGNIRKLDGAGGKRIRQKLVRAILPLIENKGTGKEYSFNKELNDAVNIAVTVAKDHETFPDVKSYLAQGSLFGDKAPDAATSKLAEIIHDEGERAFTQRMKNLNAGLRTSASGEQDIFLGGVESKESLLNRFLEIKKSITNILTKLFARECQPTKKIVKSALEKIS